MLEKLGIKLASGSGKYLRQGRHNRPFVPAENKRKNARRKKIYRRLLNEKWVLQTKETLYKVVLIE